VTDFQDVVRRRRMVRSFVHRELPAEVVQRILSNAQRGPSAGFSQGSAFLVLDGYAQTASFWQTVGPDELQPFAWPGLLNAPLLVACLADKQAYLDRYAEPDKGWTDRDQRRWAAPYWDVDTGMAALLMLLTAVDVGLGALFFTPPLDKIPRLFATFGLPDRLHLIGVVAVGYPADDRPSSSARRGRRPSSQVIHRGRWRGSAMQSEAPHAR
jgi:nitroreductase